MVNLNAQIALPKANRYNKFRLSKSIPVLPVLIDHRYRILNENYEEINLKEELEKFNKTPDLHKDLRTIILFGDSLLAYSFVDSLKGVFQNQGIKRMIYVTDSIFLPQSIPPDINNIISKKKKTDIQIEEIPPPPPIHFWLQAYQNIVLNDGKFFSESNLICLRIGLFIGEDGLNVETLNSYLNDHIIEGINILLLLPDKDLIYSEYIEFIDFIYFTKKTNSNYVVLEFTNITRNYLNNSKIELCR